MFFTLFRKEVLLHILSSRFLFSILTGTMLMVGSSWVLLRDQSDEVRSYQVFQSEHGRQIGSYETGADTKLAALAMGGRIVDRRPPQLSFLISGVHRQMPKSFWIATADGPVPETNLVGNHLQDLFALVDFRFVVGVIFSLLALLLSYDAVNGEKQDGTLRLTLTNPVSVRTLLLAKWVSLNVVLGLAFLAAFLLSFAFALFSPTVSITAGGVLHLLFIVAVSLLYLSVFITLGLLVSTFFREPYPAVATALLLWVVFIFVLPGAAPYLSAAHERGPDYVTVSTNRQDRLGYKYRKIVKSYLEQGMSRGDAYKATDKFWNDVVEPKLATNLTRNNEEFLNHKARLVQRGRDWARLSPYGDFSFVVTELAGVGAGEQLRFESAVDRYQRTFHDFINEQTVLKRDDAVTASDVPPFHFEDVSSAGQETLVDVSVLAAFVLVFFSGAFVRMLRYDVR